jgi:hypothetical protein
MRVFMIINNVYRRASVMQQLNQQTARSMNTRTAVHLQFLTAFRLNAFTACAMWVGVNIVEQNKCINRPQADLCN